MKQFIPFFLLLFFPFSFQSQYYFGGEVDKKCTQSMVYLYLINDYKKCAFNTPDQIIRTSKVDSSGYFYFKGADLSENNKIYKIWVDHCENKDFNPHQPNSNYYSFTFIANNKDSIYLPLNSLNQSFCEVNYTHNRNISLLKIDSLSHDILSDIYNTKSDMERELIYKNWFESLQKFSRTLHEPLAELYAFDLYSGNASVGEKYFLSDVANNSQYYSQLQAQLQEPYKNEFSKDLEYFQFQTQPKTNSSFLLIVTCILLLISLLIHWILYKKNKQSLVTVKDYKEVLTPQEQTILEMIYQQKSNKEIANSLFISLSTVKTHVNNIYSKLHIRNRKEVEKYFKK